MITRDARAVIHMLGATIHNNRPAADDMDDADHPTPAQTTGRRTGGESRGLGTC
jgi:hypothetical protein